MRRLDRIERVLSDADSRAYGRLTDSARNATDAFYWRNMDPLWSVDGTEPRTEFLARVTFAELRWTAGERGLNGVNSDWGAWYVRTGRVPPAWSLLNPATRSETNTCKPRRMAWYQMNDTTVVKGPAASWSSLAKVRLDSMMTQVARFRGPADSTDAYIATLPPTDAISRSTSVAAPVRTDFWLLAGGIRDVARDSVVPSSTEPVSFVRRVAPGPYLYRFEASVEGGTLAARGAAAFVAGNDPRTGFSVRGFGMSDVVVARSVTALGQRVLRRWTDATIDPLVSTILRGSSIAALWENYELSSQNGAAHYTITLTIRRAESQSRGQRIAATIVGALASAAGVQRSQDAVTITIARAVPHAETVLDNMEIDLGATPAGTYLLSLRITDVISGRTTGRSQQIRIVDPGERSR